MHHETVYEDGRETGHGHGQHTDDLKISLARPVSETTNTFVYGVMEDFSKGCVWGEEKYESRASVNRCMTTNWGKLGQIERS